MTQTIEISHDRDRLDVDRIHAYLSTETYWATGRPRELTDLSIAHSECLGAYDETGRQVGFARWFSDRVAFAWIADVFVFPEAQGRGIGRQLVQTIIDLPELEHVKRFALVTLDAHGVYEPLGFLPLDDPGMWMERLRRPAWAAPGGI